MFKDKLSFGESLQLHLLQLHEIGNDKYFDVFVYLLTIIVTFDINLFILYGKPQIAA